MPNSFSRTQRLADQIQSELAHLLLEKAHDPRFHELTITGVEVSPDMAQATVYVSQLDESHIANTLSALRKAAGFFRFQLAHSLNLRITPELRFVYDDSISRGAHISKLINDALKKHPTEE